MEKTRSNRIADSLSKLWDNTHSWFNGSLYKRLKQFHYSGNLGEFSCSHEEIGKIPEVLLHGTTAVFLDEITRRGLLPQKARDNAISLTDNVLMADLYSLKAAREFGGEPAVLIVDVRYIRRRFKQGYTFWYAGEKPLVIFTHREFRYDRAISPNRIKDWYICSSYTDVLVALVIIMNRVEIVDEKEKQEREYFKSLLGLGKPVSLSPSTEVITN